MDANAVGVGSIIADRYRIEALVARGSSANVYRARDLSSQAMVAVKVLRPGTNHETTRRFLAEGPTLRRLSHRNCVRGLHHGRAGTLPYVVMSLVEGEPLAARIGRPLPENTALALLEGMLHGVAHVHAAGLVHRDLKPDNIVLRSGADANAAAVIVDFGMAKAFTAPSDDDATLTLSGLMSGTPAYMSPEQAMGLNVDERSDLYSIGMIAYELLEGRRAFEDTDPVALLQQHIAGERPPLRGASPGVQAFVDRLCARLRSDRFASADAALAELRTLRQSQTPAASVLRLRARDEREERARVEACLRAAMDVRGAMGAAVAEADTGAVLGTTGGGGFDLRRAAAGNAAVVRAKMALMRRLDTEGSIEDILVTLRDQVHLIRPLRARTRFVYLVIDREQGNLAMARRRLASLESLLRG
ncbi:MAG: serine/threonine-protein kinase [Myxococcota bacterium]